MKYQVKNVSPNYHQYTFAVIRDCRDLPDYCAGFWFYDSFNDITTASQVAKKIDYGIVVESSQIEVLTHNF